MSQNKRLAEYWDADGPGLGQSRIAASYRAPVTADRLVTDGFYQLKDGQSTDCELTLRRFQRKDKSSQLFHNERRYLAHTRWVSDGDVESYINEHGEAVWELPSAYADFREEFNRWLHRASGTLTRYGYGIGPKAVEIALRALAGKGRYSVENYDLIVCDDAPTVLLGPAGTVLIREHPIHKPDLEGQHAAQPVETPAGEMVVEEGKPAILTGIERFASILDQDFDITITDHVSPPRSGTSQHRFAVESSTVDGETIESIAINADALATLGQCHRNPTDVPVCGGGVVDAPVGDGQYRCSWDGPDEDEEIGRVDKYGRIVVGYEFDWRSTVTGPKKNQACVRIH
ncbi:hypothetical protein SAMN05216388_10791, partial [Halorientalis persicus]